MTTKHEQIIAYIEKLPIDAKISVRSIARNLQVSDGTAYRAIKEAENRKLVKTVERVGTVRVENQANKRIEHLNVGDVIQLADCTVHGGAEGMHRQVRKFIIGAMQEEDMRAYLEPHSLMIVGNREATQRIAIENNVAVLITGGFRPSASIIQLANERQVPVMSVTFDTYTIATIINKAMNERAIQQDILLVEDIYVPFAETAYLYQDDLIKDYRHLNELTTHSRFPVVNKHHQLVGIITAKDLFDFSQEKRISQAMTKNPIAAKLHFSVASVTHMMVWDGLEMLPVVDDNKKLLGILSRQDVLKTMQYSEHAVHSTNRIEHLLEQNIEAVKAADMDKTPHYRFTSDLTMADKVGGLAASLLGSVMQIAALRFIQENIGKTAVVESVSFYFFQIVQLQSTIEIVPVILEEVRRSIKLDITVYHGQTIMAKAVVVTSTFTNHH